MVKAKQGKDLAHKTVGKLSCLMAQFTDHLIPPGRHAGSTSLCSHFLLDPLSIVDGLNVPLSQN